MWTTKHLVLLVAVAALVALCPMSCVAQGRRCDDAMGPFRCSLASNNRTVVCTSAYSCDEAGAADEYLVRLEYTVEQSSGNVLAKATINDDVVINEAISSSRQFLSGSDTNGRAFALHLSLMVRSRYFTIMCPWLSAHNSQGKQLWSGRGISRCPFPLRRETPQEVMMATAAAASSSSSSSSSSEPSQEQEGSS